MQGRDPRDAWAFTQRICGVCTVVHAVARAAPSRTRSTSRSRRTRTSSATWSRDAVHPGPRDPLLPPARARLGGRGERAEGRSGRTRRGSRASISPWPNNRRAYFARGAERGSRRFVGSGQLGIFANGYWGHPAYKLPPEVNLLAVAHYLEALDWQRDVIRLHTIFGGKNPHPNFLVGGMASRDQPRQRRRRSTPSGSPRSSGMITRARDVRRAGVLARPLAIAGFYKEWASIGGGVPNFLAVRRVPRGRRPRHRQALLPARDHPEQGSDKVHAYDQKKVRGVHPQLLVRVLRRRQGRAASIRRRDDAEVHRPEAAVGRTCRTRDASTRG